LFKCGNGFVPFNKNAAMKKLVTLIIVSLLFAETQAQPVKKAKPEKKVKKTEIRRNAALVEKPDVVRFNSTSANAAFGSTANDRQMRISDPLINWFNSRANNINTNQQGWSVFGMPKLSYGIAHGHIIFQPTAAPTSGTFTGSGSVGSGSTMGSVGTHQAAIGVNGKNPYAGPAMYGIRVGTDIQDVNSATKSSGKKE
jgi:hypothetical protein